MILSQETIDMLQNTIGIMETAKSHTDPMHKNILRFYNTEINQRNVVILRSYRWESYNCTDPERLIWLNSEIERLGKSINGA